MYTVILRSKQTESGAVAPAGTAVAPVIAEAQATEHFTKEIELAAEVSGRLWYGPC